MSGDADYGMAEYGRMLRNLIRIGKVTQIDLPNAKVKVSTNGLITGWLHWGESCAGEVRTWSPPIVGEQVVLLSPCGDVSQAIIGMRLNQDTFAAPFADGKIHGVKYADGAETSYNRQAKELKVLLPSGGKLILDGDIELTGNLTMSGNVVLTGNYESTGTMKNNSKNVGSTHTHNYNPGAGSSTPTAVPNT